MGKLLSLNYYNAKPTAILERLVARRGGRRGLALARYYGDEFDGFLVGAPAFFTTNSGSRMPGRG
jgi:hypothetical protein